MTSRNTQASKWETTRAKGFWRFVLVDGALFWGLGTAILFALITWLRSDSAEEIRMLPLAFILFPLGGILWGATMWWLFERMSKRKTSGQ
ncbi:hypothetical protein [Oligella urethralis]|nr:hypothetical protein [Oligella urethralis]